jgi:hypothetical protein
VLPRHADVATIPVIVAVFVGLIAGVFSLLIDWVVVGLASGFTLVHLIFLVRLSTGFNWWFAVAFVRSHNSISLFLDPRR